MKKCKMKFTIEINLGGTLYTKRYATQFHKLVSQEVPLSFHQLISIIPAIRFHRFKIESSQINENESCTESNGFMAVVNVKNVSP